MTTSEEPVVRLYRPWGWRMLLPCAYASTAARVVIQPSKVGSLS